jgi:hypothetical protein
MQTSTKTPYIVAVIGFLGLVAAAIITTYKWTDKPKTDGLLITGIVVESEHNKEIGQALVTVVGHPDQATTRDNGNFRIVMPAGSPDVVTLRVTKSGYKPHDEDVHIPVEGLTIQVRKQ